MNVLFVFVLANAASRAFPADDRSANERLEERVGTIGLGLELGMKLTPDEVGVVWKFHDLDQASVGARPRQLESSVFQLFSEVVVELEAMTMPLADVLLSVDLLGTTTSNERARVSAQSHRPALGLDAALVGHEVDDGVLRAAAEFDRVRSFKATYVARVLDDRELHTEADTEERNVLLSRVADGGDLPLDSSVSETSRNENRVEVLEVRRK